MSQQTALDWYIDKINEMCFDSAIHFQLFKEGQEYDQAKAMERDQIILAHNYGEYFSQFRDSLDDEHGKQYYNETYNSKVD